jgi:hypothetical protein
LANFTDANPKLDEGGRDVKWRRERMGVTDSAHVNMIVARRLEMERKQAIGLTKRR